MDKRLVERLQKVLALTTSPVEGEAHAAAAILQRLLTEHNLSIADLEKKGASAPTMEERGHDLGKAAFKWKLNLADIVAEHFYCVSLTSHREKTVKFVGRPDNVESLGMLYAWLIDQIKRISAEERREHQKTTGEHIDPLRWQVSFGVGAVERLERRLQELKRSREANAAANEENALVVTLLTEVNDYLEKNHGMRRDGKRTKDMEQWLARWDKERAEKDALKRSNPEEYYRRFPDEHPDKVAERNREYEKREARNARRRTGRAHRAETPEQARKREQSESAEDSGRASADRINLQPFIEGNANGCKAAIEKRS
jgi:hypothetical protein